MAFELMHGKYLQNQKRRNALCSAAVTGRRVLALAVMKLVYDVVFLLNLMFKSSEKALYKNKGSLPLTGKPNIAAMSSKVGPIISKGKMNRLTVVFQKPRKVNKSPTLDGMSFF